MKITIQKTAEVREKLNSALVTHSLDEKHEVESVNTCLNILADVLNISEAESVHDMIVKDKACRKPKGSEEWSNFLDDFYNGRIALFESMSEDIEHWASKSDQPLLLSYDIPSKYSEMILFHKNVESVLSEKIVVKAQL